MAEQHIPLGVLELTSVQHELTGKYANTILNGTVEQAKEAYEIIFDKEPEEELDMQVFQALCEHKLQEQAGDYGIKGVIEGGKGQ